MRYREEIYDELLRVNRMLSNRDLFLNLDIVGGAALIFNGINSIETSDIDTIYKIDDEIKDILEECSVDINDDALEYVNNFEKLSFIQDTCKTFSNINIRYLNVGGVIKTKMKDTNPDKLYNLYYLLEEEMEVEMTIRGIAKYIEDAGEDPDIEDIENFLNSVDF